MEEPLYFTSDGARLFGVLHLPDAAQADSASSRVTRHASRLGLVFCPPFAEEHKQGYRIFVELARRLEADGFPSLRFDYRGTGDSEGPFTDFSIAGSLRDIAAAADLLCERAGVERIGLIGLRLGASLAWLHAQQASSSLTRHASRVTHLVLWQPIVDGNLFYRLNIRRMLVRQMMTHGKATGQRDTGDEATIDLDGFLATRAMCEEIKAIDLRQAGQPPAPSLLVQFANAAEPIAELKPLADKLGPEGRFLPLVLEPFWNRLGYVDCTAAIEATAQWLHVKG